MATMSQLASAEALITSSNAAVTSDVSLAAEPPSDATDAHRAWIAVAVTESFLLCGSMWAAVLFVLEGVHKGYWRKSPNNNEDKTAAVLFTCAVISALLMWPRLGLVLANTAVGIYFPRSQLGDHLCEVTRDCSVVAYLVVQLSVYFFLWYRQHSFYQTVTFRHLYTAQVKVCSWSVLLLIFVSLAVTVVLCVMPASTRHRASPAGCRPMLGDEEIFQLPFYFGAVCVVTFQVVLFLLFCYPLYDHRTQVSKLLGFAKSDKRVIRVIRRCAVTSLACSLTDIAAMLIGNVAIYVSAVTGVRSVVYDVFLFANILFIMCSFGSPRRIARSFFQRCCSFAAAGKDEDELIDVSTGHPHNVDRDVTSTAV